MRPFAPLLGATVLASACGCVFGLGDKRDDRASTAPAAAPAPAPAPSPAPDARVAPSWQDHVQALVATLPAGSEIHALYSEGGWADAGQVIVLLSGGPKRLIVAAPGTRPPTYKVDRAMTETEWQKLAPHLATAATLADVFPQAFDALTFEYVHILADKSAAGPAKRLLVRDTGTQKIADHDALIKAFQELR